MDDESSMFRRLFDAYYTGMWRYALSIVGNEAQADDVTQQAFVKAYEHKKTLLSLPEQKQKAYLSITLRNTAINALQPDSRPEPALLQLFTESAEDAAFSHMDATASDRYDQIERVLPLLPDRYRAALTLRYDMDLSYQEVAAAMGVTENNARQITFQARYTLRRLMENEDSHHEG